MPSSYLKFKAFEQLMKDNPILSDLALFVSRHYISRELTRAKNDIHRIQQEIDIFDAAKGYVEVQKDLNDDQRAHLEIELLNKIKAMTQNGIVFYLSFPIFLFIVTKMLICLYI